MMLGFVPLPNLQIRDRAKALFDNAAIALFSKIVIRLSRLRYSPVGWVAGRKTQQIQTIYALVHPIFELKLL